MARYIVECKFQIEVELPDDAHDAHFIIEDNGCPGTGAVGRAIQDVMNECEEEGICWACKLGGENRIVGRAERVVVQAERSPGISS